MKRVREFVTSLLMVAALATACATSEDTPADVSPGITGQKEGGSLIAPTDSGSTTKDTGTVTKTCAASCKTDSECENTCPAAANGARNCCDTGSGVCYSASSGTCGGVDAGTD